MTVMMEVLSGEGVGAGVGDDSPPLGKEGLAKHQRQATTSTIGTANGQ